MKFLKIFITIQWLIAVPLVLLSQTKVYVQSQRYDDDVKKLIKSDSKFSEIYIVYGAQIDPKKKNDVDLATFEKYIVRTFPSRQASGILCIDLENQLFYQLRDLKSSDAKFKNAERKFISLIDKVKELRPNLKVGFYGIPFKSQGTATIDVSRKLKDLLAKSDVLFPSLYLSFSEEQIRGKQRNDAMLELNLKNAVKVGVQTGKPVVPFVWYRVHTSNKTHGGQVLSAAQMKSYIAAVSKYRYDGKGIDGIVYWEPNPATFNSSSKNSRLNRSATHNSLFKDYWQ